MFTCVLSSRFDRGRERASDQGRHLREKLSGSVGETGVSPRQHLRHRVHQTEPGSGQKTSHSTWPLRETEECSSDQGQKSVKIIFSEAQCLREITCFDPCDLAESLSPGLVEEKEHLRQGSVEER